MKFGNHKYDMISDLQELLFTSILQNNFTSYKNVTESVFEIKTFESLKEVMDHFLNFKSLKKVWIPFSVLKTLRQ